MLIFSRYGDIPLGARDGEKPEFPLMSKLVCHVILFLWNGQFWVGNRMGGSRAELPLLSPPVWFS